MKWGHENKMKKIKVKDKNEIMIKNK